MPKPLHLLCKRRKQQLVQKEIQYYTDAANIPSQSDQESNNLQISSISTKNLAEDTNLELPLSKSNFESNSINKDNISVNIDTDQSIESPEHIVSDSEQNFETFENTIFVETSKDTRNIQANLLKDLREWVHDHNINKAACNGILLIWKKYGMDVPCDYRTLMKIPRSAQKHIIKADEGLYSHFGIESGIRSAFNQTFQVMPKEIKINVNIDGLPLTNSSSSQFWPILASICPESGIYTEPFVVGIYHGEKKPKCPNDFIRPFVEEMKNLEKNGISINQQTIPVSLHALLCDAPAKSYICQIKSHNGYEGCSKCIQEGDYIQNRMTFPEVESTLRTDESFRKRQYQEHHIGEISCLEELKIDMIKQIPLDPMHLVFLGVTKRLIQFWDRGLKNVRFNAGTLRKVNERLLSMSPCISREFARKPRCLDDIDRWKATELRQFLLYTGPVVLLELVPIHIYTHFLTLSVAIRILSDQKLCKTLNTYANELLRWFVINYGNIYGEHHVGYNVHNLVHLSNDVENFGPLDTFSCFKYENYLGKLKSKVRTGGRPLHQIVNRIHEQNYLTKNVTCLQKCYPSICYSKRSSTPTIKYIEFSSFTLSKYHPNNYCLLQNGDYVIIRDISNENNKIIFKVQRFLNLNPFFNSPCNSEVFGIFAARLDDISQEFLIEATLIKSKCLFLPFECPSASHVLVPIIHAFNN